MAVIGLSLTLFFLLTANVSADDRDIPEPTNIPGENE